MDHFPEGNAIIYCEGAYLTTNGKTAHGLVRKTRRYRVLSVIDSACAGRDAGLLLDGRQRDIPVFADLDEAIEDAKLRGLAATHFVIGLAPDGGRMTRDVRSAVIKAIRHRLNVDSGLHDFLSDDLATSGLAEMRRLQIRDVRKPPPRSELHAFSGKIEKVTSLKVALLGTDSAVGKRTTAWMLVDALNAAGHSAELIGTGQTAWMQGARYGIVLDSLINDFVAGELEHAVWTAWKERKPDVIVVEGQGSLMNPAYPGGLEILAATRPDAVILQHAPHRKEYDGFPGYALHPLEKQIQAVELLSEKPVIAVTINHEGLTDDEIPAACAEIERTVGRPAYDVLCSGAEELVSCLLAFRDGRREKVSETADAIEYAM
jgi:uncharacterized NAD-dependent epimerase/dehydratase family protein